ncbi:XVIPCD domain-containing protein [Lysobacter sp. CA199]|uniref:XVIPCD domain-containing protein n=1 Tax=Lysobacter sp. CA199 TaxID=3455608 RepID=UPI003F8D8A5D
MSMTTQQYANLAQDAYRSPDLSVPEQRTAVIDGVRYAVLAHVDRASGYQGTIYQREDTKEIVVAHRGSEFKEQPVKDGVLADGGMVAKRVNAQADDALELTRLAMDMALAQAERTGKRPEVTVTGHSLGGCLAQITAAKLGLSGEAFNPYGAASLNYRIAEGGDRVVNHVMAGDVVSAAGKHFGEVKLYAEPVELNVLKVAGYEDNGDRWDLRNPLKAAVTGGDSHRMHHFLDVDGKGRADRSVLGDGRCRDLAEAHRPMLEKYRSDILAIREGVSIGAALAAGVQGVAGEIGRRLPDKARDSPEPSERPSPLPLPSSAPSSSPAYDPRHSTHPDHPMYLRIREGVDAMQQAHGAASGETGERTAASLLVASKERGLNRVDHVVAGAASAPEPMVFAVQGDLWDPSHKRAQVSAAVAAATPLVESFRQLEAMNPPLAGSAMQEPAHEQVRSAAARAV